MNSCLFVHSENIAQFRHEYNVKVAVIARPDDYLKSKNCTQIIVETDHGIFTRLYLACEKGINFLIVYGRHNKRKTTSLDIDFSITQEAISLLGVTCLIGTFVVGCVNDKMRAGSVYIVKDFIGLSGYNHQYKAANTYNFRNKDLFYPFDDVIRKILIHVSKTKDYKCNEDGVYGCLVSFPRLETQAEYKFYQMAGCDIVGKTLDPEVTLAHSANCKYAAIAVTIDDAETRKLLSKDPTSKVTEELITKGRKNTFDLFLSSLEQIQQYAATLINNTFHEPHEKSSAFYCRPIV